MDLPHNGNYPHGTGANDPRAPWNAPEAPEFDEDEVLDFFIDREGDAGGYVAYEGSRGDATTEDCWWLEVPHKDTEDAGPFDTFEDCMAYALADNQFQIEEQMEEEEREAAFDRFNDPDEGRC